MYLRFIVDHYDHLPTVLLFLQDDMYVHIPYIDSVVACLQIKSDLPFTSLHDYHLWRPMSQLASRIENVHVIMAKLLETAVGVDRNIPAGMGTFGFYCCGLFAIGRDVIRRQPLHFYRRALSLLWTEQPQIGRAEHGALASDGRPQLDYGGWFEHSWHVIFGESSTLR